MSKKPEDNAIRAGFGLATLIAAIFVTWFSPIAFVLACAGLFFTRRNLWVQRAVYLIAIIAVILTFSGFQLGFLTRYLGTAYNTYRDYFTAGILFSDPAGMQIFKTFFKIATFTQILLYFVLYTCLAATIIFTLLRFISFVLFARKSPYKKLLAIKKEAKPQFKKYNRVFFDTQIKGVPLGVDLRRGGKEPVYIPHSILNRHICLVGTTGSGKTRTLYNIMVNAMLHEKPVIYIDGKGDFKNTGEFKEVCALDIYDNGQTPIIVTMDGNTGYNPFASGTPTELTDKIISIFDWTEEHYKLSASRFIQLLLNYMRLENIDVNLTNIINYSDLETLTNRHVAKRTTVPSTVRTGAQVPVCGMTGGGQSLSLGAHAPLPAVPAVPPKQEQDEAAELLKRMKGIDPKAIQGIQARLASLAEGDLRQLFNAPNPVDLNRVIETGGRVLFSLDSLRYPQQAKALGRLIVNDLKACVSAHQRRGGGPVGLFFDEFNVFASHEVVDVINKSRSAGFEAVLAFQSLSDIDKLPNNGEALRRQIIQNCNTFICQLQIDSHDAEEISALFGTFENVEETVQADEGTITGMGSFRKVREFNVHPDEIKQLAVGQAFVKITGFYMGKVQIG